MARGIRYLGVRDVRKYAFMAFDTSLGCRVWVPDHLGDRIFKAQDQETVLFHDRQFIADLRWDCYLNVESRARLP